jgi:predicted ATPase
LTRALAIGRMQQAKSWELRAALDLARLWRDQGKRSEARDLLSSTYGWFSQGFDTARPEGGQGLSLIWRHEVPAKPDRCKAQTLKS